MKRKKWSIVRKNTRFQPDDLKAGILYKSIVRKALENKFPELNDKEIEGVLQHGNMDEIKQMIDINWVIERVTEVLRAELSEEGIRLPSDFADVIKYSLSPEEDLAEVVVEVKLRSFSDEGKEVLRKTILASLSSVLLYDSARLIYNVYLEDIFKILELDPGTDVET